jgi:hypothetical protein
MQTIQIELHKPHEGQRNVLESKARFRVLMCGRRWGKSLISRNIAIEEALNSKRVAYITPTYKLGKKFFDKIIKTTPENSRAANRTELTINFITGGSILFFTGENLDAIRGDDFDCVIIDEACYIPNLEDGWNNAIRPTLTDRQGRALFISTPRGKDFFYRLYLRNGDKDFESFKYTTYDNPFINNQEIDDARASLPTAVFEQEYLANPMENAANPFGMDFIRANIQTISQNNAICYGIDVAKSYDYTVIIGLDAHGSVCHYERFQADWNATKEKIKQLDKVPKVIDATGVGDPIVEDLQRDDYMIEGFKFTSTSKQQLIEGLVLAIQQGLIKYPGGTIVDELSLFEYVYTKTGVRYSAPNGMHDDAVCSLALAWRGFAQGRTLGQYALI